MLLNSETSVKVALDIIHDATEFFTKWGALTGTSNDVPEGYVDFEFSNGWLLRIPCVWKLMEYEKGDERPSITLKNGDLTAEWTIGDVSTSIGTISGVESDKNIQMKSLSAESIIALGDVLELMKGTIDTLNATRGTVSAGTIHKITGSGHASINRGTFVNIVPKENGTIDMDLTGGRIGQTATKKWVCGGEIISPVLKMNAWSSLTEGAPKTDAQYTGIIPYVPFDSNAYPTNGFDNPLVDNPFFPDWIYVSDYTGEWRPHIAWVPSYAKPEEPSWQDTDGIYWHAAQVVTNASMYGSPCMVYPPRCGTLESLVLPPVKKEVNGLIITVECISANSPSICLTDRYVKEKYGTWRWSPGVTRHIKSPYIKQFILKREFSVVNGEIAAFEYQLLPLGVADAAY